MINLMTWRTMNPGKATYKLLLPIHDAVLLEVPGQYARIVAEEVLPFCMTHAAQVPSFLSPLAGYPRGLPFSLGIDVSVGTRWGEKATAEELKSANVPDDYIHKLTSKK
jgi:hypothetical protein